ncbi:Lysozyme RrrD [Aquimixticola soesokkakensis]|uniref:Lysozyme n=1 Tax=Aquimixticola soesokkakensis TaxID=1519096 RepID=A0A1Y5SFD3_9RHOB|nr:lysozyme [Aquimixticola soesokkakensis]SLN36388.1 Lysozyme RrrD [Aquimixticola soesokkakensis]
MKLIPEWRAVLTGAWSSLIAMIGAVVLAAGSAWEYFAPEDLGLASWQYLLISSALSALVTGARVTQQEALAAKIAGYLKDTSGAVRKRVIGGAVAAVMALSVPMVAKWEGMRTEAYRDVVGVWTVCAGETDGVRAEDSYTAEECSAMLGARVAEFHGTMLKCVPEMAGAPIEVQAAVTSWSYNVGTGAACGSTLARYLRAGDWRAACDQLPRWNRAGGRIWAGLVNRRADERGLCLSGLT